MNQLIGDRQAYRVLTQVLRPVMKTPGDAAQLAAGQRDWLVRRAIQERGASWLLGHAAQGLVQWTSGQRAALQEAANIEMRRVLEADALRQRLRPLFAGPSAALLLLKGTSIEERAYPPGILRPAIDVDALVAPDALPDVRRFLARSGMACVYRAPSGRTEQYVGAGGGASLDLHLLLGCPVRFPTYGTPQVVAAAAARATQLADGTRVLHPIDATLHLLVHLAAGLGGDLRHVADARQWLAQHGDALTSVPTLAAQLGVMRAVRAAAAWLAEPLNPSAPLEALVAQLPPVDRQLVRLQRAAVQRYYLRQGPPLPPGLSALTELLTVDFPRGAVGLASLTGHAALSRYR